MSKNVKQNNKSVRTHKSNLIVTEKPNKRSKIITQLTDTPGMRKSWDNHSMVLEYPDNIPTGVRKASENSMVLERAKQINKEFKVRNYKSQTVYKSPGFTKVTKNSVTELINLFEPVNDKLKAKVTDKIKTKVLNSQEKRKFPDYLRKRDSPPYFRFSREEIENYETEAAANQLDFSFTEYQSTEYESPLEILKLDDVSKRKVKNKHQLASPESSTKNARTKNQYIDSEKTSVNLEGKTSWSKLKTFSSFKKSQKSELHDSNLNTSDFSLVRKVSWSKLGDDALFNHHKNKHHISKNKAKKTQAKPVVIEKSEIKIYAKQDSGDNLILVNSEEPIYNSNNDVKSSDSCVSFDSQTSLRTVIERDEFELNKLFYEKEDLEEPDFGDDLIDLFYESIIESSSNKQSNEEHGQEIQTSKELEQEVLQAPSSNTKEFQKMGRKREKELEEYRLVQLDAAKKILEELSIAESYYNDPGSTLINYVDQYYRFSDESELEWSSDEYDDDSL